MNNTKVIVAITMTIGLLAGSLISGTSTQNSWRLDAAKTECAQFNPTHGQFEWLKDE